MSRYILHVTLLTGDARQSPRAEVGEGVTEVLEPLLMRALTGEHVAVPGQAGYTMTGGVHGRCCIVTLWVAAPTGGSARPQRVPVLSVGVAPHSRCGAHLWRHMHERADLSYATNPGTVPPEPWCADRLDVGAALMPESMQWTGDFSRCIAWTWIEMMAERRGLV